MHSYFRLSPSSRLRRPLTIFGLPAQYRNATDKDGFDKLDLAIVAYFSEEAREEIPAILGEPTFLISDKLKQLFNLYVPDLEATQSSTTTLYSRIPPTRNIGALGRAALSKTIRFTDPSG